MLALQNKNAIVTGASSGIGKAIALAFADAGANVIITYAHNHAEAKKVVEAIQAKGRISRALRMELQNSYIFPTIIDAASHYLSDRIDILVNNAGILEKDPFTQMTEESYDNVQHNIRGTYFFTQRVVSKMIKHGTHGHIINISSISDTLICPTLSAYQISKASISMLTKSLAIELAPYNIKANTISPGLIKTQMNKYLWENRPQLWAKRESTIPLQTAGKPEQVAHMAVFLASKSSWITGARFVVDGGHQHAFNG